MSEYGRDCDPLLDLFVRAVYEAERCHHECTINTQFTLRYP